MMRLIPQWALVLSAPARREVPLAFDFTGSVMNASGIFAGQGSAVNGSFWFDAATSNREPARDLNLCRCQSSPAPASLNLGMTLSVGAVGDSHIASVAPCVTYLLLFDSPQGELLGLAVDDFQPEFARVSARVEATGRVNSSAHECARTSGAIPALDDLEITMFTELCCGQTDDGEGCAGEDAPALSSLSFSWTGISRSIAVVKHSLH